MATVLAISCQYAVAADHTPARQGCPIDDSYAASLNFRGPTDINVARAYSETVLQMVKDKKYAELDCFADRVRSGKERLPDGRWKLDVFYSGLASPVIYPVHATEEDWNVYLKELHKWVSARPKSVTARVALAEALTGYAWYARGNGLADTVSASGWKLFGARSAEAKQVLEAAWKLPVKCPEWYVVMQNVALAQGWNDVDRRALFDRAAKFEPEYYPYYQSYATSILPKWDGEVGAAAKFLQESADRLGGDSGDILYFQTAARLSCGCNGEQDLGLSWPRMQKGFEAYKRQRGVSFELLNLLARAAVKIQIPNAADRLFFRIGDQWSEEVWRSRERFESSRRWATQWSWAVTPVSNTEHDDGKTKAGGDFVFRNAWKERIARWAQECVRDNPEDSNAFGLSLEFRANGTVAKAEGSSNEPAVCILKKISEAHAAETPLIAPSPTHQPRRFPLDIDPADFTSLASRR